ncbi:MAG: tRNA (N(6)-L-threonylcarbamoyladenosine(37)-C(2))-methylthiotransferase MtaB [Bacteroidales bacterium]|nr:tRNA (N(6)-L-threonylcarbamoyladenosine(37)-C(2))-methylthiotransferase MtaB [Bacteroidales bacterium]
MNPRTVAFRHFGCKVNYAEASNLSRKFEEKGYQLTGFHDQADIYVISSCAVTAMAEKKCRAAIRQAHALNPAARIAVIGCFPQLKPEELTGMEGVDIVLGHEEKFHLLEEIEDAERKALSTGQPTGSGWQLADTQKGILASDPASGIRHPASEFVPSYSAGDRTRSFLKIQDGCDYHCAYCAIPLARGHSRSGTIAQILNEIQRIVETGVKEIILTGVNIGDFGKHHGESLVQLLTAIEKESPIPRIRISSIEPDLLQDEIIDLIASSEKFMPHFHIPLQSGCDTILRMMKRRYSTELYTSRVERIRKRLPDACIAADLIVGFPGESETDFMKTYTFLEQLPVSYLHVFTYSRRDNTLAAKSSTIVSNAEKKKRSEWLHNLSDKKKLDFYRSNLGKTATVLFESDNKKGIMHGFTGNYIKVKTPYNPNLVNEIRSVILTNLERNGSYEVRL